MKDCKVVCDGVEIATVRHENGSLVIKPTKEGKLFCKEHCDC